MKKTKVVSILLILVIGIFLCNNIYAHNVEIDPEELITMPNTIFNGKGTVIIKSSVTNYSLYYQAVLMSKSNFDQMSNTQKNGEEELKGMQEELDALENEGIELQGVATQAATAYQEGQNNNITDAELEELRIAYETAYNNYQEKVTEYNNKRDEILTRANEIETEIKALIPSYVEGNWTQSVEDAISIDASTFTGEQPFVVWVKLVTGANTYYDEGIYTIKGTQEEDNADATSVTLDADSLELEVGDVYTLTATVYPSNAKDKTVTWASDDENVVEVSSDGVITALSEGTATITVTTNDGRYTATCKVTVSKDKTTIKTVIPKAGSSYFIIATISLLAGSGYIMYKKYKFLNF